MPFLSEITCFFEEESLTLMKETIMRRSSLIWKNNAGNIAEKRIKVWQILSATELVSVDLKHTIINIECSLR